MTDLYDQWLVAKSKARLKTKAQMKKAATVEKKLAEKLEKAREKAWSKNQSLNMRRLALSNSNAGKISTFKDVLSDPLIGNLDDHAASHKERTELTLLETLAAAKFKNVEKNKNEKSQALTKRLSLEDNSTKKTPRTRRTPTPPPIAMELIRPGKRKVKIPANIVENTPSKQIRQVQSINEN